MEFLLPCFVALGLLYDNNGEEVSASYLKSQEKTFHQRIAICSKVATAADESGLPPELAISIALIESGFTYPISKKGARGPMGVMTKYHCPKAKKCDLIKAGVRALVKVLKLRKSMCDSLAIYNAGLGGSCKGKGGNYAHTVLSIYRKLCAVTKRCQSC